MSTTLSHVWKPSHARLVSIDSFVSIPRGSAAFAPPALNWPAKDPADILDYVLDIGPAIVGNDSDRIASVSVSVAPSNSGDVVVNSSAADGDRLVLWLSGGQINTIYTITFLVTTCNGRSLQRSVLLPVLALSTPAIPNGALIAATGAVLTDQNGNPVLSAD